MKRKKERNAILEGKTPQDEGSYKIQDTKNLLNRVAKIKSQQKEENLKSRNLDKPYTHPSKLQRNVTAKENFTDASRKGHGIKKNSKTSTDVYSTKLSSKIPTKTFKKSSISRKKDKDNCPKTRSSNNSDPDEDDALYPIGEPIIKNLAGGYNIGYTSILYKEPETTLSGHILSGVNIEPSQSRVKERIISNRKTNTQMIEINDPRSVDTSVSAEDSIPVKTVEKFSWDKLSESIKLFSTSQRDDGPVKETPKQKISDNQKVKIPNDSVSNNNSMPKALCSDTSANEEYSMDFDDENDAEVFSGKLTSISEKQNPELVDDSDKGNEDKGQVREVHLDDDLPVNQYDTSIPTGNELENQENIIVNQIFNRLHLSQDSVCSTISDRLSTIPEDPRSHEEREARENTEKLSVKSIQLSTSKAADEKNSDNLAIPNEDLKQDILRETATQDDISTSSQQNPGIENNTSNFNIQDDQSYKVMEQQDQIEENSSNKNSNNCGTESKDSSDRIQTAIHDSVGENDGKKSFVDQHDSNKTVSSKMIQSISNKKELHDKLEDYKHSSQSTVQYSVASSVTSSSFKRSTDTSSESNKESLTVDKSLSKNDPTSYQFSEISNISEGQIINMPLLSEGELSATLKSIEESIQGNLSNDYLADDSENYSDQNKLFVPKKSQHSTHNKCSSTKHFSNKRRHELKSREKDMVSQDSSSSVESNLFSGKEEEVIEPSNDKLEEDDIKLSEGELSSFCLQ